MTAPRDPVAAQPVGDFAEALASEQAVPGGGAAAAISAALAASLTAMVVRLSLGRPKYAEHTALHEEALRASDEARARFLELADDELYRGFSVTNPHKQAAFAAASSPSAVQGIGARQPSSSCHRTAIELTSISP